MRKIHFLLLLLFLLSVIYVVAEYVSFYVYSEVVAGLTIPVISVFYLITSKKKMPYFTSFLVVYSLAHLLVFLDFSEMYKHFHYYLGNILYIIAYVFLIIEVVKDMPFKGIVPRFNLTIAVLLLLNSYVLYTLLSSDFSSDYFYRYSSDSLQNFNEQDVIPVRESLVSILLEFLYNLVILCLLNVSFINYLFRENKRALLLFIGTLSVVFSEVIQYVIFYPSDVIILNIVCYLLMLVGFLCFYLFAIQSTKMEGQTFKVV